MFFKKLLLFLIILLFCDFIVGNILRYFYFKQESGLQYRTTYSIENTKADVIILGSSRANHHYHSEVFEKRLKMTCYNAGRDGNSLFYHYAVLKGILTRYSPKIVILDFIYGEFRADQSDYEKLSILLPYYKNHPEIRSIVDLQGYKVKLKIISSIYPFNSSLLTILIGNTEYNKKRKEDVKGYIPLQKVWKEPLKKDIESIKRYKTDSIKVNIFKSLIEDCKKAKVKLFVICSPIFVKYDNQDQSVQLAKDIANHENIVFLDFSQASIFLQNPSYFQDPGHLNDDGAKVFSNMLIDSINSNILQ